MQYHFTLLIASLQDHIDVSSPRSGVSMYNNMDFCVFIFRAITNHMSPPMEIIDESPKYQRTEFDDTSSFVNMEELIIYEEQNVIDLLNCALKIAPSMLGNDGIRKTKTGKNFVTRQTFLLYENLICRCCKN